MSRGIAYRRQQKAKRKRRAKRRLSWQPDWVQVGDMWDLAQDKTFIGKRVITPCPCSCWMCGNPRRDQTRGDHERTIQERRAFLTNE